MKVIYTLAFILCFSAFAKAQQTPQKIEKVIPPTIAVKVMYGDAVNIDGVVITFLEVLEDSRCPKGTTCIWAGQAKVKVLVKEKGQKAYTRIVTKSPGAQGPISICERAGYTISIASVLPVPEGPKGAPDKESYYLNLVKQLKEEVKDAVKERGSY
ncbi:hypothetical protein EAX61_14555 [Dokdonia sinensis]|uniref:Uncharacterized protein n=1 Tax=Dokdonia sinensis TaxID=2479847 RepID=A0A3M0G3G0_9FLAO|nr:hypothetical protein [Dokdonia sinensis]RMB56453.1 hypothetical protein EAX61_14555 [Dokdonia sinensis]